MTLTHTGDLATQMRKRLRALPISFQFPGVYKLLKGSNKAAGCHLAFDVEQELFVRYSRVLRGGERVVGLEGTYRTEN